MKLTYEHPKSILTTQGIRLGVGAMMREGDKFDSTSGRWSDVCHDQMIEEGCAAIIVRDTSLSAQAVALLLDLVENNAFLALPEMTWGRSWKRIPTSIYRPDPRADLSLVDQQPPPELIELGLISLVLGSNQVYGPTAVGREVARDLRVIIPAT